jgi:segregation and condensation protein B
VNSDYSIQKLLEKELIIITGRNESLPGKPLVYATSKTFMDYFGINSAADLPKIKEVLAEQMVEPTIIKHLDPPQDQGQSGEGIKPLFAVDVYGDLVLQKEAEEKNDENSTFKDDKDGKNSSEEDRADNA